jgi:hypothetical protein
MDVIDAYVALFLSKEKTLNMFQCNYDNLTTPEIAHNSHKAATSLSNLLEKGEVFVNGHENEICLMVCYGSEPECAPEWVCSSSFQRTTYG